MAHALACEIGIRPWEFWEMTPAELTAMLEGARTTEERRWYRTAWQVAYLLTPYSKKKLTPEKLLGRPPKRRDLPRGGDR